MSSLVLAFSCDCIFMIFDLTEPNVYYFAIDLGLKNDLPICFDIIIGKMIKLYNGKFSYFFVWKYQFLA